MNWESRTTPGGPRTSSPQERLRGRHTRRRSILGSSWYSGSDLSGRGRGVRGRTHPRLDSKYRDRIVPPHLDVDHVDPGVPDDQRGV